MLEKSIIVSLLSVLMAYGHDDKEANAKATAPTASANESAYIQIDTKKSKKYEIYTLEGSYIAEGILDFNSRADVSNLKSGNYLIVIGKKAFQFTVN